MLSLGSSEIERILTFRDRLRNNVLDRKRYEETKRRFAEQAWGSMNDYAEAKTQVVEEIIALCATRVLETLLFTVTIRSCQLQPRSFSCLWRFLPVHVSARRTTSVDPPVRDAS